MPCLIFVELRYSLCTVSLTTLAFAKALYAALRNPFAQNPDILAYALKHLDFIALAAILKLRARKQVLSLSVSLCLPLSPSVSLCRSVSLCPSVSLFHSLSAASAGASSGSSRSSSGSSSSSSSSGSASRSVGGGRSGHGKGTAP